MYPEPRRKAWHPPNRRLLFRRTALTLAAGFECRDGLVFATDQEVTDGITKRLGAKSTHETHKRKALVLAGAGNYDLLGYACERIIPSVKAPDVIGVVANIRKSLHEVWKDDIDPFYAEQEKDQALHIVAGIAGPRHRSIYVSNRSVFARNKDYAFVGCGSSLAYYLAKQKWSYETTVKECVDMARWIVGQVGENTSGVGEVANITTVDMDGHVSFVPPA
jgi:20S proteasome alpha/beta subunit